MIALWETIWKSLWNKSVQHSDMDLYLNYLRRDEFQPTNYPDRIRSKVMQYVCDDWSIPLRANETNADNRTTQFETGNEINSCTSCSSNYHTRKSHRFWSGIRHSMSPIIIPIAMMIAVTRYIEQDKNVI